jgi:hypothetical protein
LSHKHKPTPCPCGKGKVYIRGRCQTCYARVYRLVRDGSLTWRQAERRGIVLKAKGKMANCGDRKHVTPELLGNPYAK